MRIRFTQDIKGRFTTGKVSYEAGQTADIDQDQASYFIKRGIAEPADQQPEQPVERAIEQPAETPEPAEPQRPRRPRGRKR